MSPQFESFLRSEMVSVQEQLNEIKGLLINLHYKPAPVTPTANNTTLFDLIDLHTEFQKIHGRGKKGKPLAPGTIQNYSINRAYLLDYLTSKGKTDEPASNINAKWYQDFERFATTRPVKPLKFSSINVAITFVKQVLAFGVSEGYIDNVPGLVYKLKAADKTQPKPLTPKEMETLETYAFPKHLQPTVDAFIFLRYTGFHFIDGKLSVQAEQLTDENGLIYLQKLRQKTGELVTVPFHTKAQAIANKYGGLADLPFRNPYTMNRQLKRAAKLSGVRPDLTLSMARDTFADYYTNDAKMSDENLAAMLGHVDTSQLKRYRQVKIRRIAKEWKE